MTETRWQTVESLRDLLNELVSWKSMTLSEGEREFPVKLQAKLQDLAYFQQHSDQLELHDADLRRKLLTALYRHPDAKKTICLISHFDTVNTEEYGDYEPLATQPEELTKIWTENQDEFSEEVRNDLHTGEYLFGRGTMDMKMGLVLHMRLIEKASMEKWPINLLLLTVPDEEVNSAGMRAAVPVLLELQDKHQLTYTLFLNSEPVFTQEPKDHAHYLYTGSIGKLLAAALFYGKETHAGEPLSGLTSPYIASYLTREMEWNDAFQETVLGETTPLPLTLQQTDLRLEYSTQTPYRSSALYNIFTFERSAADVFDIYENVTKIAAQKCNEDYQRNCKRNHVEPIGKIKVIRYKTLLDYATAKLGKSLIEEVKADIAYQDGWDDREKSLRIADKLMIYCQELAPAIIILFAPPYYPAVNSTGNTLIEACTDFVKQRALEKYNLSIERVHYFNGLCDLSYVNYQGTTAGWTTFEENTPVWGDSYSIPFAEMQQLEAPVLNIGPFGKDAHKRTERLHIKNAFEIIPAILDEMVQMIWQE
ncbi:M20/M25/M40 family metallo-hydrolase [Oceanobacillus chungangensis]|uniref:Amino acid degradation protein n=1 Tax=Oceanobacillus chungangensis TaxID=1229152 RepID=A0A3D8PV19_9BACI|nr:M20/M25/M40 family metallo-hydrolase [Oceanobacillus chungangensis]RDW19407.1 amino acid degradation protein [Oceanobacillus chungangensis]